jgi:uncharacterized membrane protein YoaK (UPF0700 family)
MTSTPATTPATTPAATSPTIHSGRRRLADTPPWSRPAPLPAEGAGPPARSRSGSRPWLGLVRDPGHGPLPALLLVLTAATGLIDAVSILGLGRVFVANMTGNVVFLGFALAGAPGFSLAPSLAALAGFLAGALAGGRVVQRWAGHRGLLLRNITALELGLVALSAVIATVITTVSSAVSPAGPAAGAAVAVAALLAVAMGLQNTMARQLAVPDLTTTVLTMTLTGIAADARRSPATTARRALAGLTMFAGALGGALLALHTTLAWALAPAVPALAVVVAVATAASRHPAGWHNHNAASPVSR